MPHSYDPGRLEPAVKVFWRRRARSLRAFLSARVFPHLPRTPSKLTLSLTTGADVNPTDLQMCCERALDAHTVEDAIFWHSEVINELSVEIFSVAAMPGANVRNERMLAELTDLQSRHGAILHRLTGIVARNEQLIWEPASICKK